MHDSTQTHRSSHRRGQIVVAVMLGVAVVGAVRGFSRDADRGPTPAEPTPRSESTSDTNQVALLDRESLAAAAVVAQAAAQPDIQDRRLKLFMRQKLTASGQILEGLCTENMDLVIDGAKQLHEMSEAELWHASNDVLYKQFSAEFRQITKDLIKAAEEKKVDRITLKWLDATVSCLDCHRFVRGARIAGE